MSEQKKIVEMLIDIFDRIDIQTPCNFDSILEFVTKRISDNNLDVDREEVDFSFKLWIESNVC